MIIGYLIAMVCIVLFIPWLYTSLIITLVQDIRKPSSTLPQPHNETRSFTPDPQEQEEEEIDEEMEFYDYMCGDPDPHVVYEDDPHFVFPRIKMK